MYYRVYLFFAKDFEKIVFLYEFSTILSMHSLFSASITPLASILRPEKLDDLVGQSHLIGSGKPIRKFIEAGRIPSILLW